MSKSGKSDKSGKSSNSNSGNSKAPSLEIHSDGDVQKALGIMNKHPMTLVLVYAVWCPHCHTFMEQWKKYKKLPNRNSPMITVEQTFMNKLLPHIQTKEGAPMSVDGFPTVLLNMNKGAVGATKSRGEAGQNVGEIIQDPRDESAMNELLSNSRNTLMGSQPATTKPSTAINASAFRDSIQGSQVPTTGSTMSETENASNYMTTGEGSLNANTNTGANENTNMSATVTPSASAKARRIAVPKKVATAIKNASNAATSLRSQGSEELNITNIAASEKGSFVSKPMGENVTMKGGGCAAAAPSGLCQLGGGSSRANSLFAQLEKYVRGN